MCFAKSGPHAEYAYCLMMGFSAIWTCFSAGYLTLVPQASATPVAATTEAILVAREPLSCIAATDQETIMDRSLLILKKKSQNSAG